MPDTAQSAPAAAGAKPRVVVDVHTHMYPPEYIKMLEARTQIPLVRTFPGSPDPRLVLLEEEVPLLEAALLSSSEREGGGPSPSRLPLPGRPLTRHHTSLEQKVRFMDAHGISVSVLSLANPWVDFAAPAEAGALADAANAAFSRMCGAHPGRLYFFAALPAGAGAGLAATLSSINRARALAWCRGFVMGTAGAGRGMDDPDLLPVLDALAEAEMPVFLHPHYGLQGGGAGAGAVGAAAGGGLWGPRAAAGEYGHVLPLALGFPMETTVAVARMYLSGAFDRVPKLRVLLAHAGGTLPFLAGRIESCVMHDGHLAREEQRRRRRRDSEEGQGSGPGPNRKKKERRTLWEVLREQMYLDAVVYSAAGLITAIEAAGGDDRIMFGTDHPFFPPVGGEEEEAGGSEREEKEGGQWESVMLNIRAVQEATGGNSTAAGDRIMGENAVRILRLEAE